MSTQRSQESVTSRDSHDIFAESLDLIAIRTIALEAYQTSAARTPNIDCTVVQPCSMGAYNVVYELRFSDECSWAIRIPLNADPKAMRRCLLCHEFISTRTSLPAPQIHAYSLDSNNMLHHPFIIMDFARGTRLVDVWYDQSWWTGSRSKSRTLASLARHMVQLASVEFEQIGALDRDDTTGSYFIGPFPSRLELTPGVEGPDYPLGPFETQHAYLRALLASARVYGTSEYHVLMQLFVDELPDPRFDCAPFTLGHPDLDSQNVFVDDETGEISALIDFDGLAAVPRQLGALSYPAWLTVDWDAPTYHSYKENNHYDHADALHDFRTIYVDAVREWGGDACADVTRNSHIMDAISIALTLKTHTNNIVYQLGKLLCGSARLTFLFAHAIRKSGWLSRDRAEMVRMPEFLVHDELFPKHEDEVSVSDALDEISDALFTD